MYTLPCYRQFLNKPEDKDDKTKSGSSEDNNQLKAKKWKIKDYFFATRSSTGVQRAEPKIMQEAQQADPILIKHFNLTKAELTRRGIQISPQGILCKVMDGKQLMMVPHELHQKILVKNHDVTTARHVGSIEQ